jgi:hypothetical protein
VAGFAGGHGACGDLEMSEFTGLLEGARARAIFPVRGHRRRSSPRSGAELSAANSVGLLNALHNYWVVLFSLTITDFPFAFLLTPSCLSGIDPSLEGRPRRSVPALGSGSGT